MKFVGLVGLSLCSLLLMGGCATMGPQNRQLFAMQAGGMIGSATGTVLGDRIGGWGGSVIGSVVGGVAGSAIGAAAANPEYRTERAEHYNNYESQTRVVRPYTNLYIKDIILDDENGNRTIDRNERCRLTFIIRNEGRSTVREVVPELISRKNARYIRQSQPITIRDIKPGETIRYQVNLWASPKLKHGEAQYTIRLNTRSGRDCYEETFAVPTHGY